MTHETMGREKEQELTTLLHGSTSSSSPLAPPAAAAASGAGVGAGSSCDATEQEVLLGDPKLHNTSLMEEACSIWNMAWKVSLATFCRISLSTISTAFLGHLGSNELAASALAGIWTGAVQVLILGYAVSVCTLCGQAYGAKNYELVGIWLQLAIISLTLFSIPVMISYCYVDRILSIVTHDQEVLRLASLYAKWSVPTVWPQAIYCAFRQYLQAQEIVTPATIISVLSVGVCLVSNYVLIYGLGPFPGLHFIGSPLAQVVASWFQPISLWLYVCWFKGYHKKTWYGWTWGALQRDRVRRFMSLSLGMTLDMALDEWVYNVVSAIAGNLGAMNLAANSVLFNFWGLIFGVLWGFGLPTQVRVANFLGANQPQSAKRTMMVGFVLGGASAALSALVVLLFQKSIIGCFTNDPIVTGIISDTLPVFCLAVFLSGLHVILAAVVEAMSLASTLVTITACGSWLVMLPTSYVFGLVLNLGLDGLWWGSVGGEGTKFVLMVGALWCINWEQMALKAVKQSEATMDDQEVQDQVEFRASLFTTPSMPGVNPSPLLTTMTTTTPDQSSRRRGTPRFEQLDTNDDPRKPRSRSYGAAGDYA